MMGKGKNREREQETPQEVRVAASTDNAVLLLAAAEEAGLDPGIVRVEDGTFAVPGELADKAGVETLDTSGGDTADTTKE